MKRLAKVLIVLSIVFVAMLIIFRIMQKNKQSAQPVNPARNPPVTTGKSPGIQNDDPATAPQSVSAAPLQSLQSSQAQTPSSSAVNTPQQAAILAAADSVETLSSAQFMPDEQRKAVYTRLVVAESRAELDSATATSGQQIARVFGYPTIGAVRDRATYSVQALKHHVDSFSSEAAVIKVFVVTHWLSADGKEYSVPGVTVVELRSVKGTWLYVRSSNAKATEMPKPMLGLTYDETLARFQPYLKGYKDYEHRE